MSDAPTTRPTGKPSRREQIDSDSSELAAFFATSRGLAVVGGAAVLAIIGGVIMLVGGW